MTYDEARMAIRCAVYEYPERDEIAASELTETGCVLRSCRASSACVEIVLFCNCAGKLVRSRQLLNNFDGRKETGDKDETFSWCT